MIAEVAMLFLTGLVSLFGQIILLRELNVVFYGTELVYLVAMGVWMLLTAAGAWIGGRRPSTGRMAVLFLCFALCLPLGVLFLRGSRLLLGGIPCVSLPFPQQMAALFISLLPMGLLSGLLFRNGAALHTERGRTPAGAFGIESAGGLAAGLLATLFFRWGVQNLPLAFACSLLAVFAALLLLPGRGNQLGRAVAVALAVILIASLYQADRLDRRMTGWNHPGLLATRDSPYGRITTTAFAGQLSSFENGAIAFKTEGKEPAIFAHLAALQHPEPRRILVLGGGWDGTLQELLQHQPVRVDMVLSDLDPVSLLRRHLPAEIRKSLTAPAVRFSRADPREFLKKSGFAWDLILIGMPEPSSGERNRFYTREFFAQCAARLHPGGIVALSLPAAEDLPTPLALYRTAGIYHALSSVFPEILVLSATTTVMTASSAPFPRSPEILTERLQERGIRNRLVTPPSIRSLFTADRFDIGEKRLREAIVPENTDIRPVFYPFAVMAWLSQSFPRLSFVEPAGVGAAGKGLAALGWILGIGLPLLFFGSRLQPAWRRGLLVVVAGVIGIASGAVLILAYQAKKGLLYQDIGLLLGALLAGLALGVPLLRDLITSTGLRKKWVRGWGVALLIGLGIIHFAAIGIVSAGAAGDLLLTGGLLASTGFLVGGLFAYTGLFGIRDQRKVIGPLYATGLIGGCFGAILGGLFLIPLFGFIGTLKGLILLAALTLLLI